MTHRTPLKPRGLTSAFELPANAPASRGKRPKAEHLLMPRTDSEWLAGQAAREAASVAPPVVTLDHALHARIRAEGTAQASTLAGALAALAELRARRSA